MGGARAKSALEFLNLIRTDPDKIIGRIDE
jgi:hypothetical protein